MRTVMYHHAAVRRTLLLLAVLAAFLLPGFSLADDGPVLPPAGQTLTEAAEGLDAIAVSLTFDPAAPIQVTARQTLTLTNRTGGPRSEIVLRSYSGAFLTLAASPMATDELFARSYGATFSPGGLILDSASLDDAPVAARWLDGTARTVLCLPLDDPWLPGETRTVTLIWHAVVPECAGRFGHTGDLWMLGNLIPTPALFEDGEWEQHPYTAIGDPFRQDCVNWDVTLTLPEDVMPAAPTYAAPTVTDGLAAYHYTLPAARDFALVLSDAYHGRSAMDGDVLLLAYALDENTADAMLMDAHLALQCFTELWGEYVYPSFTVAEVDFPFGGMEYPGLVMIARDIAQAGPASLEYIIAHEAAHQWWAIQAGSDSCDEPWMDESLATYAMAVYIGRRYGDWERAVFAGLELGAAKRVPGRGLTSADGIDRFADLTEYSALVYDRPLDLWFALEKRMGRQTLHAALADYQRQFRFRRAERGDLTRILSEHAGTDLAPLMATYLDTPVNN